MDADDPRERLRRYLEQRRELGETELVLDSLDVGEVLRLVGAHRASTAVGPQRAAPPASIDAPPAETVHEHRALPEKGRSPLQAGGSSDWRAALTAAGAAPGSPPSRPKEVNVAKPQAPTVPTEALKTAEPLAGPPAEPGGPGLVVGGSLGALIPPSIAELDSLGAIATAARGCTRCPLYATATNAVPGEGNPNADFMIVGEAPGATEDETGRPFVGAAGQLLTKIIEAINLTREDVFIANVLKHRPPGNRNPKPDEVAACSPYLLRQIELVQPRVILALGTFAAQTLLETKLAIGKLRGQVHQYHGVPLIVTYHPAALLRNPAWKRPTWEDVQLARRILDSAAGA